MRKSVKCEPDDSFILVEPSIYNIYQSKKDSEQGEPPDLGRRLSWQTKLFHVVFYQVYRKTLSSVKESSAEAMFNKNTKITGYKNSTCLCCEVRGNYLIISKIVK